MDENEDSTGLSGWAWYEFGCQSEQSRRNQREAVSAIMAGLRGRQQVNVAELYSANEALWRENQQFVQRINALVAENWERYHDYRRLKDWANAAEAELIELRAEKRAREAPQPDPDWD